MDLLSKETIKLVEEDDNVKFHLIFNFKHMLDACITSDNKNLKINIKGMKCH